MEKPNREKTYNDITHAAESHPDDRGVGEIVWNKKLDCWICDRYDYTLTDDELAEGLKLGWAK